MKQPNKTIAIPALGQQPAFQEIAEIMQVGAACDLSICILGLTPDIAAQWQAAVQIWPTKVVPHLLEADIVTLTEWQTLHRTTPYDITLLHGLEAEHISATYIEALLHAIPAGMVVII